MALFPGRLMIILRKRNGFVPQVQLANRKFSMKPEDEKADGQHNVDKIWIPSWLRSLILRPIGYVPKEMFYNVLNRAIRAEKEVAKKEEQLKSQEDILWRATARSAMDNFEKLHGSAAVIDRSVFPSNISFDERTRRVRQQRMAWILKNCSNEREVGRLISLINKSKSFSSLDDFSGAYATAYYELSEELKKRLLYPGVGEFTFKGLTTDPESNAALRVFIDLFEFPFEVVVYKCEKNKLF